MANRLAKETSPYLLQHAENPVDWYAWGEEALARAKAEQRPILLSIGYSACHWCHVMEHESFEDQATANFMNENFVCIKVDREERPDVDDIYMEAVQMMTGHGGWPLTAFCDPDGVPFYTGTYFPPEPRQGMPSFGMVMDAVVEAWANRREEITERAPEMRQQLGSIGRITRGEGEPGPEILSGAEVALIADADPVNGGFGGAPKFPPASAIEFLLARGEREICSAALDAMAAGGIHDQLAGGFARYSVDPAWLVPHFEKMLYDNALLARAYLHGWQATGSELWGEVCASTLDWALAEMRGPEGGFASALDADSEGEEGRFYVWTTTEFGETLAAAGLGDEVDELARWWGVSERGNFEGKNILHLPAGLEVTPPAGYAQAREALLEARSARVRPGLDDKRLCSWNALMIAALADAGAAFGRPLYTDAARRCAEFVLAEMRDADGRLLRTWKDGEAKLNAYLEDHAYLLEALLTLYEATFEVRWYEEAVTVAGAMVERFHDDERGGFFTTSHDHEELIARRKDFQDHPIPSGNSAAAYGLLRLEALSGDRHWGEAAEGVLALFGATAARSPQALAHLLLALDFRIGPATEVALIAPAGADSRSRLAGLASAVRGTYNPRLVVAGGVEGEASPPLLADRGARDGETAAYVCENFACQAPVTEVSELAAALARRQVRGAS